MTGGMSPPVGGRQLSDEQQAIVQCQAEALRVVAFAGTGKTTTLRAYAQARPRQRMLYLAFNRSVAQEAQGTFGAHVCCSTIHGLAYRAVGYRYRHKLRGSLRPHEAAQALGLSAERADLVLADRALQALQHFLCSGCGDLGAFARLLGERYAPQVLLLTERLWALMQDPVDRRVPMLHDGYLKLYQLSEPQLRFDVILLDEAQDTNPVTLAILAHQACAKVVVGDPHQQIYQFRHATNAMAGAGVWQELALTGSFRFGDEIAAAANRLLRVKGETRQLRGLRQGPVAATQAVISRGNAALYLRAVALLEQGQRLHWCGGIAGYRHGLLLDLWHLQRGERQLVQDRFVASFKSYDALSGYAADQDVRDLKAWCYLLERRSVGSSIPEQIAALQRGAVERPAAGVVSLATAHKSKGLEFGVVELTEDFYPHELLQDPPLDAQGEPYEPEQTPVLWDANGYRGAVVLPVEELNLRYVAVTRAQGACRTAAWGAPLFEDLERYLASYPRCVLVDSHMVLKPHRAAGVSGAEAQWRPENKAKPTGSKERGAVQASQQPLHRLMRAVRHLTLVPDRRGPTGDTTRDRAVNSPTCPTPTNEQGLGQAAAGSDTSDTQHQAVFREVLVPDRRGAAGDTTRDRALSCPTCPTPASEQVLGQAAVGSDTQPQAVVRVMSPASSGVVWHLGALDPSQVRVVVQHYRHRYPALDWGWLLNALAELRLVAEPHAALAGFAEQQKLASAMPVLKRFLQDVGLWVVAE